MKKESRSRRVTEAGEGKSAATLRPRPFCTSSLRRGALPDSIGITPSLLLCSLLATGCVRRTILITSEPPGALVWLNDREIGRTPVDVDFLYYGRYDVRLVHEAYEPLLGSGLATAPWWDTIGLDLVAELLPIELRSETVWHYDLEPKDDDPDALLRRAGELRSRVDPSRPGSTPPGPDG